MATPQGQAAVAPTASAQAGQDEDEDVLVTEFPPPPYYFRLAASHSTSTSTFIPPPPPIITPPTNTEGVVVVSSVVDNSNDNKTNNNGTATNDADNDRKITESVTNSGVISSTFVLTPPEIPYEALKRASKRAEAQMKQAKLEAEQMRLKAEASEIDIDINIDTATATATTSTTTKVEGSETTTTISGTTNTNTDGSTIDGTTNVGDTSGVESGTTATSTATTTTDGGSAVTAGSALNEAVLGGTAPDLNVDLNGTIDDDEDAVAVFGEFVEDPLLAPVEDYCEDPTRIRDEVSRLNKKVLGGFVRLVEELVKNNPLANKKCRDDLSHTIFLMLQECNKFREHQAREILIQQLEEQLAMKKAILNDMKIEITKADTTMEKLQGRQDEDADSKVDEERISMEE